MNIEGIKRSISVNANGEDMQEDEGELEGDNEGQGIQADEVLLENYEGEGTEQPYYQYEGIARKMREEGCGENKPAILKLIIDQMGEEEIQKPPNLRNIERSRMKRATGEVNAVLRFIETKLITETK